MCFVDFIMCVKYCDYPLSHQMLFVSERWWINFFASFTVEENSVEYLFIFCNITTEYLPILYVLM